MKKFYMAMLVIIIIMVFAAQVLCASAPLDNKNEPDYYSLTAQVIAANGNSGVITVIDSSGNMWEFTSTGKWDCGNDVCMLMDGKYTHELHDDEIIAAWFYNQLQYFINNK